MWEEVKARVLGIAENAVWDAIKWLFGGVVLAAIAIAVGWIKGVPGMVLFNIFVVIFVSVLFLMIFIQLRRIGLQLRQAQVVSSQIKTSGAEVGPIPLEVSRYLLEVSSRDAANRDKIAVLVRGDADLASSRLQEITVRLLNKLNAREDDKDTALAELVRNTVYLSCNRTHNAVLRALKDQTQGIPELQRHLEEFVCAYHKLARWMIRLLMVCDLEADAEHEMWHGRHEKFHDELRKLLALDDFSKSRERLGTNW
jgi:hypothetical protein